MKKKILLLLIFALTIIGLVFIGYFRATPGLKKQTENLPKIEISPKVYDFGVIRYGDIVSYGFKVRNLGQEILEIKRVATSCSCTQAKIAKEKIEPGEEVELLVSYDSDAMPLHGSERQERIIYLRSNDPINPQAEVRIYATVKPR